MPIDLKEVRPTCASCRYFLSGQKVGDDNRCRRYPPQVSQAVESSEYASEYALNSVWSTPVAHFPPVAEDDWCGEWEAAPREKTKSYGPVKT